MSSTITVYVVPLERLRQVVGSGDQSVIADVCTGTKDFLATIDDIDDETEITCAEAVADLVNGNLTEDAPGYLYGYALESICAWLGEELTNICGITGATGWIEEVDEALEQHGVAVSLNSLVYGGSPIPIPEPDDYPFIGHWPADQLAAALPAVRAVDVSGMDLDTADTLKHIGDWLEEALKTPGGSIVGFLS